MNDGRVSVATLREGDRFKWAGFAVEVRGVEIEEANHRVKTGRWISVAVLARPQSPLRHLHYYDDETVPLVERSAS